MNNIVILVIFSAVFGLGTALLFTAIGFAPGSSSAASGFYLSTCIMGGFHAPKILEKLGLLK